MNEEQKNLAYLVGRLAAAEKALQTLIGSHQTDRGVLGELLKTNFGMRRESLTADVREHGLPEEAIAIARTAFVSEERAVFRGLAGGRFVAPAWKEL